MDFSPSRARTIKSWFEKLKTRVNPDVILTHRRDDAHQDHRQVCRLTWNTFRDHCILEYEIPKWDGDMGQPNLYVPISAGALQRKIELLNTHFGSQRSKQWFDAETFLGLARLRGMECRAPERYAEAFLRASSLWFDRTAGAAAKCDLLARVPSATMRRRFLLRGFQAAFVAPSNFKQPASAAAIRVRRQRALDEGHSTCRTLGRCLMNITSAERKYVRSRMA